jgi:predicted AlkP superfamily pyrophosphatase or phosphodiesterase
MNSKGKSGHDFWGVGVLLVCCMAATSVHAQGSKPAEEGKPAGLARPKLVVMIVVDQFRADYVDKFEGQWTGGLKRLVEEGAWFRASAYPYAATETCVGHSTISTGALPTSHGMVANGWWDREAKTMVTCTSDGNARNVAYGGGTTEGGDSAWRMLVPSFAEELKFQGDGGTRVATFSIKARAAITLAGHKADAAVWLDSATGSWVTSSAYQTQRFMDEFARAHPIAQDYGKTWALSLPKERYLYPDPAIGAETVEGWGATFPHALRGKEGASTPDQAFYYQWATSPFANTYLTKMAENAVDALRLGKSGATDYLGVSYSSVDYVGHTFGPRSWEVQDVLVRLDQDLEELFRQLDQKVGRGAYVVALTGDHGVGPTVADSEQAGFPVGVVSIPVLEERMEKALEPFHLPSPAIARLSGNELYFAAGVYEQLQNNPAALTATVAAALSVPGIAAVYTADVLKDGPRSLLALRNAAALSYFAGRSGDLYILQRPYWQLDGASDPAMAKRGASHGTPYYYDQRVPILMMGFGIKHGEYFEPATPADIAPTLSALTGVILSTRDGRVLSEALEK